MKEFLEKYMKNSVSRYLAVYIDEVPSVEDLRRFEDTMGPDLGIISDEDYEKWATKILGKDSYMIYRIFIEQGILKVKYSTEVEGEEMEDYCFGKDIEIFTFEELWEKYIVTDDEINVELTKPSEQQQKNKSKILQWIEDNKMTEREKELQEDKYTLQEEVELLQDTIQDMEEEIKTLNIIIKYLENKAGL